MWRYVLIGLGVLVALVALAIGGLIWYLMEDEQRIVDFLKNNPDKSSFYLLKNGQPLISLRPDQRMPLASTVKILVAIGYAQEVSAGRLRPDERVPITDLARYYLPNTDGGAHREWLKDLRDSSLIQQDSVTLEQVAEGMIAYSSNANTEYLCDRIGLDRINALRDSFSLTSHEPLGYIVSTMMLYQPSDGMSEEQTAQALRDMPLDAFISKAAAIHERLKNDHDSSFKKTFQDIPLALQEVWSDRLTGSTAREYAGLMARIQDRTLLDSVGQQHLEALLEWPMAYPKNKIYFTQLGMKGGSTGFLLTEAMYLRTRTGDRYQMALFFRGMGILETMRIQNSLNKFSQKLFQDEGQYIQSVRQALGQATE